MRFFRNNRNVRSFTTDGKHFLDPDFLNLSLEYELCLVDLTVTKNYTVDDLKGYVYQQFDLLHQIGFYKRLHFPVCFSEEVINQIASLNSIATLCCGNSLSPMPNINWSLLKNLKKITIHYCPQSGSETLEVAKTLVNLEEISLPRSQLQTTLDDILPFVFYNKNLQRINVPFDFDHKTALEESRCFEDFPLNLAVLNIKRKKLNNAKKVTIYVSESVYLHTKRTVGQTNFDLIELKKDLN